MKPHFAGCNSHIMKTWKLKSAPFLQALHFLISLGSSISPLLADWFLSMEAPDDDGNMNSTDDTHIVDYSQNTTEDYEILYNLSMDTGFENRTSPPFSSKSIYSTENLLYPYWD